MCEYCHRIRTLAPSMSGMSIYELFQPPFQTRFPYHSVSEGFCLGCGKKLSIQKRRPHGRATRSLCQRCYKDLILSRVSYDCFICGLELSNFKIQAQSANPREIGHNIHDGQCTDYFTLVHCKVVGGVDMSFIVEENRGLNTFNMSQTQYDPAKASAEVEEISAAVLARIKNTMHWASNYRQVSCQRPPTVSSLGGRQARLLNSPKPMETMDFDMPYNSNHRKKVKVIRLPRNTWTEN